MLGVQSRTKYPNKGLGVENALTVRGIVSLDIRMHGNLFGRLACGDFLFNDRYNFLERREVLRQSSFVREGPMARDNPGLIICQVQQCFLGGNIAFNIPSVGNIDKRIHFAEMNVPGMDHI